MLRSKQLLLTKRMSKRLLSPAVKALPNQVRLQSNVRPWLHEAEEEIAFRKRNDQLKEEESLKRLLLQQRSAIRNATEIATPTEVNIPKNELAEASPATSTSPSELLSAGNVLMPITSHCHIVKPTEDTPRGIWPVFRLMDENGEFRDGTADGYKPDTPEWKLDSLNYNVKKFETANKAHDLNDLRNTMKELYPLKAHEFEKSELLYPAKHDYPDTKSDHTLMRAYRNMVRLRQMDTILQNAQRQGRISFYMTCNGEEAIHIGAASALTLQDTVLAQYREAGVLMWRGFTLEQFTSQCFSNVDDLGKGRQMPVHYGSRALNYQTISSNLGSQIPQAAGAAYQMKLAGKEGVAICFFGDGCASTIDFHSGLNFAATLGSPVIFFCRNNGYAISTPSKDQYAGDGIISRAPGYGMAAIRVDGNDVFAVNAAVREAKKYALEHKAPVLIEAMTYRQGHHSTSDDSLRYRDAEEVQSFQDSSDPIERFESLLQKFNQLEDDEATSIRDEEKMAVLDAMREAENKPKPFLEDLFTDVYHELTPSLQDQRQQLQAHLEKYPDKYTVTKFKVPVEIKQCQDMI